MYLGFEEKKENFKHLNIPSTLRVKFFKKGEPIWWYLHMQVFVAAEYNPFSLCDCFARIEW